MTAADALRRFLWDNGFYIAEERYAVAAGKPYAVLTALSAPCIERENTQENAPRSPRVPAPAELVSASAKRIYVHFSGEREAFSPEFRLSGTRIRPAELVYICRPASRQAPPADCPNTAPTSGASALRRKNGCAARLADGGDPADELLLLREAGEFL